VQYGPALNPPSLPFPALLICSSYPCCPSTWEEELLHVPEQAETLLFTGWIIAARRGNPGGTKDYLGFMKPGRKPDMNSSLPIT